MVLAYYHLNGKVDADGRQRRERGTVAAAGPRAIPRKRTGLLPGTLRPLASLPPHCGPVRRLQAGVSAEAKDEFAADPGHLGAAGRRHRCACQPAAGFLDQAEVHPQSVLRPRPQSGAAERPPHASLLLNAVAGGQRLRSS